MFGLPKQSKIQITLGKAEVALAACLRDSLTETLGTNLALVKHMEHMERMEHIEHTCRRSIERTSKAHGNEWKTHRRRTEDAQKAHRRRTEDVQKAHRRRTEDAQETYRRREKAHTEHTEHTLRVHERLSKAQVTS